MKLPKGVAPGKVIESAARFLSGLGLASLGVVKRCLSIVYHVAVVALSAGIALLLPATVSWIAQHFLAYWSLIENEKIFLVAVEITLAVLLILFINYFGAGWRDRKFSRMARRAGMDYFASPESLLAQRRVRRLKERQGFAKDVMVIASTGFRTFVDPKGDLHNVLKRCREAKIMLLDPSSEGAVSRAKSMLDPGVTVESFKEQIQQSIEFLKDLKAAQKNVRLKLYRDPPFLKLEVLGDYVWVRHYHAGMDVRLLPEYLFVHNQNLGSLYMPFYQYFLIRWEAPEIPEYDLDADELIFRDRRGNPARREPLPDLVGWVDQ